MNMMFSDKNYFDLLMVKQFTSIIQKQSTEDLISLPSSLETLWQHTVFHKKAPS